MGSLYKMCVQFTTLVLQPSHIVLHGGGFALHRDLATPLVEVYSSINWSNRTTCLTSTAGYIVPATQNQIVWNWIVLIDKLYVAMKDLWSLYNGRPVCILGCERPSLMPRILMSLTPLLLIKLPADFLQSYSISIAKAREAVHRMAQALERGRMCSHSQSPLHGSHAQRNHTKAGGLTSPQVTTVEGAARITKSVSLAVIEAVTMDTPRAPHMVAAPNSRCEWQCTSAMPTRGLDCSRSPLRGKQTYFIINPHHTVITDLRGAGNIEQLPCAWDCLVERLRIVQDIFERYLSRHLNDPERQACDAAAHRRVMHWAACEDIAQRARRAAGARTQGEPPNLVQVVTIAVSPPERSLPLSTVVMRVP
ncbi:hypothetical protein B0H14DRAFT_3450947 [Mycena olivaceomarginata]|nr:hypothetical protein B0H14DRAFT_3450947 [Mycena olivaceomarginata]